MRQYHIVSTVIVALTLIALLLWRVGGMPWEDGRTDRVIAVERFGGNPQESIRALCLATGERVVAGDRALRRELETGTRRFLVSTPQGDVEVLVIDGPTGPHFRTKGDGVTENNLLSLPDC